MDIYSFGLGQDVPVEVVNAETLGGKGYGLVWMSDNGFKVPPGFVLPCTLMQEYGTKPKTFMKQVAKEIKPYLKMLQEHFGYMPLLSVRSGARVSMPGMMDTILNVGLDAKTRDFWRDKLGHDCVEDSHSRLVTMYANVVCGIDKSKFSRTVGAGSALSTYLEETKEVFPDTQGQLLGSIEAVFKSWNNERAKIYRKLNNIPEDWGTAVVVQAMVFGNLNDKSGTGVLFTRNPDTGDDKITGEFLINGQGEDVVDGSHTPMHLSKMKDWNEEVAAELLVTAEKLETAKGDVQDVEFTIQDGQLYILQTRNAKRTPKAALRIALDLYAEGVLVRAKMLERISARDLDLAQQTVVDPKFDGPVHANGLAACSGVVSGVVVYTAQAAIDCTSPCILVTKETTPDDIGGMYAAAGILTMEGGATCHAAVVARGMNKPCIVGTQRPLTDFPPGTMISIDGSTGRIWLGTVPVIEGSTNTYVQKYYEHMRAHLKYVPIIYGMDAQGATEVLFSPGASILTYKSDMEAIENLVYQSGVERLYIDLRNSRIDPAEQGFYRLYNHTTEQDGYSKLLLKSVNDLTIEARKKIVLLMDFGAVIAKGLKVVRAIDTLEALVMADGEIITGTLDMTDAAVKKVLEWKKDEPMAPLSYGTLAPGLKSFIHDEQALQVK